MGALAETESLRVDRRGAAFGPPDQRQKPEDPEPDTEEASFMGTRLPSRPGWRLQDDLVTASFLTRERSARTP
jgi:hypothetical protein